MLMSEPCCHQGPCLGPWSYSTQGSMLMSAAHVNHWRLCRCPWSKIHPEANLKSTGHAAAGGHIDVSGLCCHLKPCWCPWFGLPPRVLSVLEVILKLVHVCAITRNHEEAHDLTSCWLKSKEASLEEWLMIADAQWRRRNIKGLSDNPYHPRKPSKTTLENW